MAEPPQEDIAFVLQQVKALKLSDMNIEKWTLAASIALTAHAGKKRDQGTPYIEHPLTVLRYAHSLAGVENEELLQIALLHDVIEDDFALAETVRAGLGERVFRGVLALSKESEFPGGQVPKEVGLQAYHKKIRALPDDLLTIKLCDRLHNIQEIVISPSDEKRRRYCRETRDVYLPLADALATRIPRLGRLCEDIHQALARAERFGMTGPAHEPH